MNITSTETIGKGKKGKRSKLEPSSSKQPEEAQSSQAGTSQVPNFSIPHGAIQYSVEQAVARALAKGISNFVNPLYDNANKVTGLANQLQKVTSTILKSLETEFGKIGKKISDSFQLCIKAQEESSAKMSDEIQNLQSHVHHLNMSLDAMAFKQYSTTAHQASTSAPTPVPPSSSAPSSLLDDIFKKFLCP